jgi:hypothetical protein
VLTLLIAGLGSLLLLNTLLAQGSFVVHDLDRQVAALGDREQALEHRVATLAAPKRLARQAASIGMVPSQNPAFLRVSDGRVLGVPVSASGPVSVAPPVSDPKETRAPSTSASNQDQTNGEDKQTEEPTRTGNTEKQKNNSAAEESDGNGKGNGGE